MQAQAQIGVINPYALGEMVAGRPIDWNSLADPQKKLAEILHVPEEHLFDLQQPILNPALELDAKGGLKQIDPEQAHKRLQDYLQAHLKTTETHPTPGLPQVPIATLKNMHNLIHTTALKLQADSAAKTAKGSGHAHDAWQPADRKWLDKGRYFDDVDEFSDPVQGALADCYLIAAMASVAWSRPYAIVNMVRPSRQGDEHSPIHEIRFHRDGRATAQDIEVSEKTPVDEASGNWVYARSSDQGEIWPAVMEKAYAKWKSGNDTDCPPYPTINFGDPVLACAELVGGKEHRLDTRHHDGDRLWDFVRHHSLSRRTINPMVAWTYSHAPDGLDYAAAHVVPNHAYSVLGWAYHDGHKYIVARNPWYTHHATVDTLDGVWEAYETSFWERVRLNTHGVFAMRADTFGHYFAGIGAVT